MRSSNIYAGRSGGPVARANVVNDDLRAAAPCYISVDGRSINDTVLLISVTGAAGVNYQMDLTFSNSMFTTIFGDKVTQTSFTGVAFPGMCPGSEKYNSISNFFSKYKASNGSDPAVITLGYNNGDFVFTGMLTDMQLNPYNNNDTDGFSFTMAVTGRCQGGVQASADSGSGLGTTTLGDSDAMGGIGSLSGGLPQSARDTRSAQFNRQTTPGSPGWANSNRGFDSRGNTNFNPQQVTSIKQIPIYTPRPDNPTNIPRV